MVILSVDEIGGYGSKPAMRLSPVTTTIPEKKRLPLQDDNLRIRTACWYTSSGSRGFMMESSAPASPAF